MMKAFKKRICLKRGFIRYTFESDPIDLVANVIAVCNTLNAGKFVIEVFSKDPINESIFQNHEYIGIEANLTFYQHFDVDFLNDLNLENVRHMFIYSIPTSFDVMVNRKWLANQSKLIIILDNYLEVSELVICKDFYSSTVIEQLIAL